MLRSYALLALLTAALARPCKETIAVCQDLATQHPSLLAWDPLGPRAEAQNTAMAALYNDTNGGYWNAQNSDEFRAACAFVPESAEHVSSAVQALDKHPSVRFGLKSGGHQAAPGFSSTDGGVLISFRPNLNSTLRTEDGKHFVVGAGARWGEVYGVTQQTNEVVVGGRLGDIGVGGFVLGGGLSYYSAQYGLACDNVDIFEAVLANGTIVNATAGTHSDLWWALRGGGNQFAIVTRMWLQAHSLGDQGKVWGGVRAYHPSQRSALFTAIANFVASYPDSKAAMIPTFSFALPGNALDIVTGPSIFFFYDGEAPPAGVFDEFDAISALSDNTGTTSYTNLTSYGGGAAPIPGFGASFRVNTFPNMPTEQMREFYMRYYRASYWESMKESLRVGVNVMTFVPQPLSRVIANASQARGGNALGLDPGHGDRVWIENSMIWSGEGCNENCPAASKAVAEKMEAFHREEYAGVEPTGYEDGDVGTISYSPLFMNDAAPDQDVYSSYGVENLAKLKNVKQTYDPEGFFTEWQGGFKLPEDS